MSRLLEVACKRGLLRRRSQFGIARASLDARVAVSGKPLVDAYKEGQNIHGFRVNQVADVEELNLTAVRLEHLATAAQYFHLRREDGNNAFAVGFRTTPTDSTGLPHILEHTTLCGSEKFPCRDPFFKMLRRSLATFMNAMTGPDYTVYPFSTQNLKDFRNLQAVYLDSVFKPNLRLLDFRQEGWRLEHANVNDKTSPIVFKGVVFNEMKGAFSQNESIFAERLLNSILPSHTYAVISGGDPLVIPQLTHQDLVNFHAKYYHPSNARFFSYGNFPLEDHLRFVNDEYLCKFDHVDASATRVPPEKRWNQPKSEHIQCRPDPMATDPEKQSSIAVGWLCSDITNVQETFELYVLSQLLLKGPNSAFYKSLVEPNIGGGFSPVTGYDSHSRDTTFVVGLQGVSPQDFSKVDEIVQSTVAHVVNNGFEQSHVEAVLHGIELNIKHQTSNFGLNLLLSMTPLWNHEGDIVQAMKVNQAVATLRKSLERNPRHLCDLVNKYLKENKHRLTLTMSPDETYEEQKNAAERAILAQKLDRLSPQEFDKIFEEGQALVAEQEKKEDTSVLPSLKIEDLEDDIQRVPLIDLHVSGVPLQLAIQPTNDVTYFRGILNIADLDDELKDLVPLFNTIVAKMGTANYDYRTFDQMTQLKTGGLSLSHHIAELKNHICKFEEGILFQSYCLDRNSADMWKLWEELFNNVDLTDMKRFETLVKVTAANVANGIADLGHIYALSSSASLVSPIARRRESLSGLDFVEKMKRIAQAEDLSPVLSQMQQIAKKILNKKQLRSALNLSSGSKDNSLLEIQSFYEKLQGEAALKSRLITDGKGLVQENQGIHHVLPFPVNYASKSILTVPYQDSRFAALRVLSKLVTSVYLHPEVREKGGAYGGGAKLSSDGVFSFFSYRDPNSTHTLEAFDRTYEFLQKYTLSQEEIDEAKLGIFQHVDSPVPPGHQGMTKFIHDLSDDEVQLHRIQLKAVTKDQLMAVAEEFLKPESTGVLIGRSLIGRPNPALQERPEKWTVVSHQ
ncbi:presequence protease, mitochondrial [Neodiprion fabricii]|uniref:presequence protease, mitochondrial n=1 Tax=Neodiprion fabricii TaxID=2872261 RepID=UPI001ED94A42|nr:presequence protease, mitochondrial [Neodiprion fabricii]